jgi:hypothetical protein
MKLAMGSGSNERKKWKGSEDEKRRLGYRST